MSESGGLTWSAPVSEGELREVLAHPSAEMQAGGGRPRFPTGGGNVPADARAVDVPRAGGPEAEATRTDSAEAVCIVSLESRSFARVVEYEPKDLTITVGAGMRLGTLRDTLLAEGQWLPPGAWGRDRSVGGWVAAGEPGPTDAAFGSVRRHVLAVRTIAWDGRPLTWGRAVVKNVAGYDLKGLWCGSRGRLGVVTRASLRVWPLPEHRDWLEIRGSAEGWDVLASLGAMDPAEDFRPDASVWRAATGARGTSARVGFLGSEASVRARVARAREWAASHGYEIGEVTSLDLSAGTAASPDPFAPLGSGPRPRNRVGFRVHCLRARLPDVGRRVARALVDMPGTIDALPELGVLKVSYERPHDGARARAIRAALFQAADDARIVVESGDAEELAAAEARRDSGVRALEDTVLGALGGEPRHWLADYV